jgi:hypothetical protein
LREAEQGLRVVRGSLQHGLERESRIGRVVLLEKQVTRATRGLEIVAVGRPGVERLECRARRAGVAGGQQHVRAAGDHMLGTEARASARVVVDDDGRESRGLAPVAAPRGGLGLRDLCIPSRRRRRGAPRARLG